MAAKLHPGTQIYDLDYFSGAQAFMYIGDVWVDEMTHMQWQHLQPKTPLYGYASQLFDDTADGHIIVQGAFTINFKEQGYLWACLRRYKQLGIKNAIDVNLGDATDKWLLEGGDSTAKPVHGSKANKTQRLSIERIVQGELSRQEAYDFYQDMAGYATVQGPGRDAKFADMMDVFEDEVWGDKTNKRLEYQVRNPTDNAFDDFDIFVMFGNYSIPGANHTVQKIVGVRLTSQGKVVKIDGEPIQEQYEFIAQTTI